VIPARPQRKYPHLRVVNDPRDNDPCETPEEAFKELAKGPLPEAFAQHYAAAFLSYWGRVPGEGGPAEPPASDDQAD
jgi:hypothetical protein